MSESETALSDNDTAPGLRDALPAILTLLGDYARLIDGREAEAFGRIFTADGVLAIGKREVSGRAALADFAAKAVAGTHIQSVPSLALLPDGSVDARSNFLFVGAGQVQIMSGMYHDVMVPEGDRLVFVRRDISIPVRS
jgi:SnoaL-like domain